MISVQKSKSGRRRAPLATATWPATLPPQTIHSCPVQTEAAADRAVGMPEVEIGIHPGAGTEETTTKPLATRPGSAGRVEAAIHPDRVGADATSSDCWRLALVWVRTSIRRSSVATALVSPATVWTNATTELDW